MSTTQSVDQLFDHAASLESIYNECAYHGKVPNDLHQHIATLGVTTPTLEAIDQLLEKTIKAIIDFIVKLYDKLVSMFQRKGSSGESTAESPKKVNDAVAKVHKRLETGISLIEAALHKPNGLVELQRSIISTMTATYGELSRDHRITQSHTASEIYSAVFYEHADRTMSRFNDYTFDVVSGEANTLSFAQLTKSQIDESVPRLVALTQEAAANHGEELDTSKDIVMLKKYLAGITNLGIGTGAAVQNHIGGECSVLIKQIVDKLAVWNNTWASDYNSVIIGANDHTSISTAIPQILGEYSKENYSALTKASTAAKELYRAYKSKPDTAATFKDNLDLLREYTRMLTRFRDSLDDMRIVYDKTIAAHLKVSRRAVQTLITMNYAVCGATADAARATATLDD